MALKDIWIDKTNSTNGVDGDFVDANDINNIAKAVIDLEDEPDIVADNVMSDASENPVQNKVVKNYVDENIAQLVFNLEILGVRIDDCNYDISNLTDRILNVETNKADISYVDDNVEDIHNAYGWMGDAIGSINMQLETLGMNVAENGGAISNLSDRILNVETNKADISYVDNAISSAINEALEGDY